MERLDKDVQRALNFIGGSYRPHKPSAGKLHSRALLDFSFTLSHNEEQLRGIADSIENRIGKDKTIWGIKSEAGRLSWELYFSLGDPTAVGTNPLKDMHEKIKSVVDIPDFTFTNNILMFSFDLEEHGSALLPADILHVYAKGPRLKTEGKIESTFESFDYNGTDLEFRNYYIGYSLVPIFRHANVATIQRLRSSIRSSPRFAAHPNEVEKILIPELYPTSCLAFAHKRTHDGIYFQGLTSTQLRHFIEHTAFDDALGDFIRENEPLFDYLEWDAGFDYTANAQGVEVAKAGIYGYF